MKRGAWVKSQETSHVTYVGGSGLIYLVGGLALAAVQHPVSLMAVFQTRGMSFVARLTRSWKISAFQATDAL